MYASFLSREEIKVQALLMLFAGHETTTSMLTFLCMALGQHPDILARARAEQQELGISGGLAIEKLKQITYLEQILKDLIPMMAEELSNDIISVNGVKTR